ncbi:O-antigen polymerase [Metabacillus sp. RGM 3146]|uniref:O-antigen polymerase n=1 Tax=Metabacillus sp. RGM 3146 TaxID=3401092 RepID=UPI003B993438
MIYILIWIMVLVLSFYLFKKVGGSMSLLTPNLISLTFYYSLFLSSFCGALLIVLNIDDHYMIHLLSDDIYRYMGFFIICFIMVFMPLTMFIFSRFFGFQADKEFRNYIEAPIYREENPKLLFLLYVGLTLLAVGAVGYTVLKLHGHVPLLELVKGNRSELGAMRIAASRDFGSSTIIRNIFGVALAPILSMITFVYFYQRKELRWFILFVITTGAAVFMQVYDLAKGPILFYLIMVVLLLIYLRIIKLNLFKLLVLAGFGVVLLVAMYVVIMGVKDPSQFLSYNRGPLGRLMLSQIAPFYLHLDLFTNRLDLLNGKSLPSSIIGMYGIEPIRSGRLAMEVFFSSRVKEGTAGVLNTLFAGEAYANFGYTGVLIGTMYIGLYIQTIYMIFIRMPKTPLFLCLFVYFTVNIPRTVIGGFADFLWNPLWMAILFIFLAPYTLIKLYNIIQKRRYQLKSEPRPR